MNMETPAVFGPLAFWFLKTGVPRSSQLAAGLSHGLSLLGARDIGNQISLSFGSDLSEEWVPKLKGRGNSGKP